MSCEHNHQILKSTAEEVRRNSMIILKFKHHEMWNVPDFDKEKKTFRKGK